jgi:uncharacterized protein (TIGR00297 family)
MLVGALLAAGIAGSAYRRGALDRTGVGAAVGLGTLVYGAGGPLWGGLLVLFFTTSSALSALGRDRKRRRTAGLVAKGERRDAWQVLANGGVGGVLAILTAARPRARWPLAGFVGATAAATADTWATEIGLLAAGPPRLITTLRPALPGQSGAISLPGSVAALAASGCIGIAAALGTRLAPARSAATSATPDLLLVSGAIGGLAGAAMDSLVGATLQARYVCPRCVRPTELRVHTCGAPATLQGGVPWLTNDGVNFFCTLSGAAVGIFLEAWRGAA